ncbi:MAG: hypothetical protein VX498_11490, partial [Myxococcota bacterium]|nr:hypothetical protein [Myxococcota bacterium]
MPDLKILVEVIGGPKTVVAVKPTSSVPELAAVAADATQQSLVNEDGSSRAWILYAPTAAGGFAPVSKDGQFEDIQNSANSALDSGKAAAFAGPGEHEGDDYRFRLRLFIPGARPPARPISLEPKPISDDEEVIDLTNIDTLGDELVSVRRVAPKRRRRRKDATGKEEPRRRRKRKTGGDGQGTAGKRRRKRPANRSAESTAVAGSEAPSLDDTPVLESVTSQEQEIAFVSAEDTSPTADPVHDEGSLGEGAYKADGEDSVSDDSYADGEDSVADDSYADGEDSVADDSYADGEDSVADDSYADG